MTIQVRTVLLCDAEAGLRPVSSDGRLAPAPQWRPGPYEYAYEDHSGRAVKTDAASRATNFPAPLAPLLFGGTARVADRESGRETRFVLLGDGRGAESNDADRGPGAVAPTFGATEQHALLERASVDPASARLRLHHAELLIAEGDSTRHPRWHAGVVAVHLDLETVDLDAAIRVVGALTHMRGEASASGRGALLHRLLRSVEGFASDGRAGIRFPGEFSGQTGTSSEDCVYALMLADRGETVDPAIVEREKTPETRAGVVELYCMAVGQPVADRHVTEQRIAETVGDVRGLSRSWSMLTLRHGAAFQLHTTIDDAFRSYAPIYFRTLYADAFMLARLQDRLVRGWEQTAARIIDESRSDAGFADASEAMRELDRSVVIDSVRYWIDRPRAGTGRSVRVLQDIQAALDLPVRLETVRAQVRALQQLADRDARDRQTQAQEAQATAQERVSKIATVLGVLVFPITICADIFQLLGIAVTAVSLTVLGAICVVLAVGAGFLFGLFTPRSAGKRPPNSGG